MGQAMGVVILSSVAAGIGTIGTAGIKGLFFGTIVALLGWFIWAFLKLFARNQYANDEKQKTRDGKKYP